MACANSFGRGMIQVGSRSFTRAPVSSVGYSDFHSVQMRREPPPDLPRVINSTAPIRICDNGGWTDTWFARHGKVFNIAVRPHVEVQIEVSRRTDDESTDRLFRRIPITLSSDGLRVWERTLDADSPAPA
ncbi:MAG: D-glycero-alpha-D-manno-heptose-7-phosphate kinase [Acidobacteriota bacterium]|nr:D-glycero-alpha-D-manno-heptose-7-phosphate kinase [Acidobacteriota bacterium]